MRRALAAAGCAALCACSSLPPPPTFFGPDRTPTDLAAFFDCLRTKRLTIVSAFRGGDVPAENAIATFERTTRGAPGPVLLQIDVRRTASGSLVLMHDETLQRTTNRTGAVSAIDDRTFAKLRLKDSDGALLKEGPPTFERALDWSEKRAVLIVRLRDDGIAAAAVASVVKAGARQRVVFAAETAREAAGLSRAAPGFMILAPIADAGDLDALRKDGLEPRRLLAFVEGAPLEDSLARALDRGGVEVIVSATGAGGLDARAADEGDEAYGALAKAGAQVIETARPLEAMRVINDADGPGAPALQCLEAG